MDRLRQWFGTPIAAGKTLIWLCWASFLLALVAGLLYVAMLGVITLFD